MAWYYNSNRIYVQEFEATGKQVIARLQPLGYHTILQVFGNESEVIKIQGKVVGTTILDTLMSYTNDGAAYTLSGPDFSRSLYLSSISYKRDPDMYQTIDPNQDCEEPVFSVSMELFYDG